MDDIFVFSFLPTASLVFFFVFMGLLLDVLGLASNTFPPCMGLYKVSGSSRCLPQFGPITRFKKDFHTLSWLTPSALLESRACLNGLGMLLGLGFWSSAPK
ncbi:hypothetical protein CFP56_035674 [Quercus suber]|uniref:Uncharacterized protein n=1 Tax=Quercus suber TaxID=58331 RepID=A0AAW0JAD1_QUESU